MFTLTVENSFAAAHQLRGYEGKCENLHGHNFRAELSVQGEKQNDIGLVTDYKVIKNILNEILDILDHKNLNEVPPFDAVNPSSENLAKFIFTEAEKRLAERPEDVKVSSVTVWESSTARCTYSR